MSAALQASDVKLPQSLDKDQKSAAAAAASALECVICFEQFSGDIKSELHPRVLPKCGHSLCSGCARTLSLRSGKVWYVERSLCICVLSRFCFIIDVKKYVALQLPVRPHRIGRCEWRGLGSATEWAVQDARFFTGADSSR
jgi:hypothetical protein